MTILDISPILNLTSMTVYTGLTTGEICPGTYRMAVRMAIGISRMTG